MYWILKHSITHRKQNWKKHDKSKSNYVILMMLQRKIYEIIHTQEKEKENNLSRIFIKIKIGYNLR